MAPKPAIQRYAAFAESPELGNPAGVVLHARDLSALDMQRIAADVGYSETAFVTSRLSRDAPLSVRYFAPDGEVDFCGHATISTVVALGHALGFGDFTLATRVGEVPVSAHQEGRQAFGSFHSPAISSKPITPRLLDSLLEFLGLEVSDLDPAYPPAIGFGGNHHPVLVVRDLARLAMLDYDFEALRQLCRTEGWVTIQLVAATGHHQWRSRNPFPWGGVHEDPATGAAAAAFAGYLQALGLATPGDGFTITQGVEMGRRSRIDVRLLEKAALVAGPVTGIPE